MKGGRWGHPLHPSPFTVHPSPSPSPCHALPPDHRLRLSRHRPPLGPGRGRRRPPARHEAHQPAAARRDASGCGATTSFPLRLPRSGASYVETADSGGWDECFPTVGASPRAAAEPDHGELWSADWTSSVYEHAGGTTLAGTVLGRAPALRVPSGAHARPGASRSSGCATACGTRETRPSPGSGRRTRSSTSSPAARSCCRQCRQARLDAVHGRADLLAGRYGELGGRHRRRARPLRRFRSAATGRSRPSPTWGRRDG